MLTADINNNNNNNHNNCIHLRLNVSVDCSHSFDHFHFHLLRTPCRQSTHRRLNALEMIEMESTSNRCELNPLDGYFCLSDGCSDDENANFVYSRYCLVLFSMFIRVRETRGSQEISDLAKCMKQLRVSLLRPHFYI